MKLVLAGSYVQFLDWCRENAVDPNSRPKTAKYLILTSDFFMYDEAELILYGEYQENPLYQNTEAFEFLKDYARNHKWKIPDEL